MERQNRLNCTISLSIILRLRLDHGHGSCLCLFPPIHKNKPHWPFIHSLTLLYLFGLYMWYYMSVSWSSNKKVLGGLFFPTSAPSPNLKPSENLVLALWKTAALSWARNVKELVSFQYIQPPTFYGLEYQKLKCSSTWDIYLSTWRRNISATSLSSVTMQSVCALLSYDKTKE